MPADSSLAPLRQHHRFDYQAISRRVDYDWPGSTRLAVYLGFNIEHFAFGEGLGARLGPPSPEPDVLNFSWREYGNRVGAWRCLELFDELALPAGTLINTSLYDHCPELIAACRARGDELIGHGHTNSVRQGDLGREEEGQMIRACRDRILEESGTAPEGWLSPWISESHATPDLLAAAGYRYTLNWCHDDQPIPMRTESGSLWAVPYPQELNDIPMIIARQMTAPAFADMIIDQFEEMSRQSRRQPLVMGIALHPYIVGQPHRLKHLRRALESIARARDAGQVWFTTPGKICEYVAKLQS